MKKLLLLLLAVQPLVLTAQQMSLEQAQQYALSNNLTVRNTHIDLEKAKLKIWETTADGLPQLSAGGTYQYQITSIPEIEFQPGQKVALGVANSVNASAALNQLIFNGSYIVGLQAAKVYRNFAELGIEKSIIEIRAAVAQSYYVCLLASETTRILQENLALLGKTLTELRAMKEQGLIDRTSLDQIEVTHNQLLAQYNSANRQIKNSRDVLKYIIGMPMNEPIELTDRLDVIIDEIPSSYLTLESYNQDENIDIKLAVMDVTLENMMLKLAKSAYLPSIGAQLGIQHNFTMPQFSFQNATTAYLGVNLNVPLFTSGKTRSKIQQARLTVEQSKNKEKLARQSLDLNFQQACDAFQLAWDNYNVQQKNVTLAARVLNDMKKSISAGMKSSTELIQSNNSYLDAVRILITSELDLLNSKTNIDKILNK